MRGEYRALIRPVVDFTFRMTYAWIGIVALVLFAVTLPFTEPFRRDDADKDELLSLSTYVNHLTVEKPTVSGCAIVTRAFNTIYVSVVSVLRVVVLLLALAVNVCSLVGIYVMATADRTPNPADVHARQAAVFEDMVWRSLWKIVNYGFFLVFRCVGAVIIVAMLPVMLVTLPAAVFFHCVDHEHYKDIVAMPKLVRAYLFFDDDEIKDFHAVYIISMMAIYSVIGAVCWVGLLLCPMLFALCLCTGYYAYKILLWTANVRDFVFWSWVYGTTVLVDIGMLLLLTLTFPLYVFLRPLLLWVGLGERLAEVTASMQDKSLRRQGSSSSSSAAAGPAAAATAPAPAPVPAPAPATTARAGTDVFKSLAAQGLGKAASGDDVVFDTLWSALCSVLASARLGLYWLARLVVALLEAALPLVSVYRTPAILKALPKGFAAFEDAAFDQFVSLLLDVFCIPATLLILVTVYKVPLLAQFHRLWRSEHTRRRDLLKDRFRFAKVSIVIGVSILVDLVVSGPGALVCFLLWPCSSYLVQSFELVPAPTSFRVLKEDKEADAYAARLHGAIQVPRTGDEEVESHAVLEAFTVDRAVSFGLALGVLSRELKRIGEAAAEPHEQLESHTPLERLTSSFVFRVTYWSTNLLRLTLTYSLLGLLGLLWSLFQLLRLLLSGVGVLLAGLSALSLSIRLHVLRKRISSPELTFWQRRDICTGHGIGVLCDLLVLPAGILLGLIASYKLGRLWGCREERFEGVGAALRHTATAYLLLLLALLDWVAAFLPSLVLVVTPWWLRDAMHGLAEVIASSGTDPSAPPSAASPASPAPPPAPPVPRGSVEGEGSDGDGHAMSVEDAVNASVEETGTLIVVTFLYIGSALYYDLTILVCYALSAGTLWQLPALVRDTHEAYRGYKRPGPGEPVVWRVDKVREAVVKRTIYAVHPRHLLLLLGLAVVVGTLWQLPRTVREVIDVVKGAPGKWTADSVREVVVTRACYAVHPINVLSWTMIIVVSFSWRGFQLWLTLLRSDDRFRALVARTRFKREAARKRHNRHMTSGARSRYTVTDLQATVPVLKSRFMRKSLEFYEDSIAHFQYWGISKRAAELAENVLVAETRLQAMDVWRAQLLSAHSRGEISTRLYELTLLAYEAQTDETQGLMLAAREGLRAEELNAKTFLKEISGLQRDTSVAFVPKAVELVPTAPVSAVEPVVLAAPVQAPRPAVSTLSGKRQSIFFKDDWLSESDDFGPYRAGQFHLQELSLDIAACLAYALCVATLYRLPAVTSEVFRNQGALDRRRTCLDHLRLIGWDLIYLLQALVVMATLYRLVDLIVDLAAVVVDRRGADAARVAVERNFWELYDMVHEYWLDFTRNWTGIFKLYRLAWSMLGLAIVAPAEAIASVLSPLIESKSARGAIATLHVAFGYGFPFVFIFGGGLDLPADEQMTPVAVYLCWLGLFVCCGAWFSSTSEYALGEGEAEAKKDKAEVQLIPWTPTSGNIVIMLMVLFDVAQVLSLMLLNNEHMPMSLSNLFFDDLGSAMREWLLENNLLFLQIPGLPDDLQFYATVALAALWLAVVTVPPAIEDTLKWREKGYITGTSAYRMALLALSDAALMLITSSCLELISCKYSAGSDQLVLREDEDTQCFHGAHEWQALVVMITLFFYVSTATALSAVTSPPIVDSAIVPDIDFHRQFTAVVNLVKLFEAAIEAFAQSHAGYLAGSFLALNVWLSYYSWRGFRRSTGRPTCANPVVAALRTWSHLVVVVASFACLLSVGPVEDPFVCFYAMLGGWGLLSLGTLLYAYRLPRVRVVDVASLLPESHVHAVALRRSLDVDGVVNCSNLPEMQLSLSEVEVDEAEAMSPSRPLPTLSAGFHHMSLCRHHFRHSKDVVVWLALVEPLPEAGSSFSWRLPASGLKLRVPALSVVGRMWVNGECVESNSLSVSAKNRKEDHALELFVPEAHVGATALLVLEVEAKLLRSGGAVSDKESRVTVVPRGFSAPAPGAAAPAPAPARAKWGWGKTPEQQQPQEKEEEKEKKKEEKKEEKEEKEETEEEQEEKEEKKEELEEEEKKEEQEEEAIPPVRERRLLPGLLHSQPIQSLAFEPLVIGGLFEGRFAHQLPCVRGNPQTVDFKHVSSATYLAEGGVALTLDVPDGRQREVRIAQDPHIAFCADPGGVLVSKRPVDERERVIAYFVAEALAGALVESR